MTASQGQVRRSIGLVAGVALVALGAMLLHHRATVLAKQIVGETTDHSVLPRPWRRLVSLHQPMPKPEKGDWLETHTERGQTYDGYVVNHRQRLDPKRRVLYVQPLGDFNSEQRKIVELTAEYLGIYFQLPVKVLDNLPTSVVPESSRRFRSDGLTPQLNATYILYDVLQPRVPIDAAAMIALTAADLWPGEGWNYVFGLASLTNRVGVWSMHRFGDPAESAEQFQTTLRRTLKVAAHETGHMFGLQHCIYYRCCMNPSNHVAEADRLPMEMCAYCQAKLCHATGADPVKR